jgi:hypothetical protein
LDGPDLYRVVQANKFELVDIPPTLLARADEVIE